MGRLTYVCASCSEHFTRRYSATRHNLTIHDGRGEIVPLLEYIVGRKIGLYPASHPSWYRRNKKGIHDATVTDSMGSPKGLQQQILFQSTPPSHPQPQPADVSPSPTHLISQSIDTTNDQGTLSQETILKIEELKRLLYRYPQYYRNPDAIIKCATYWSINGDNMILDEMLEKLRMIASDD